MSKRPTPFSAFFIGAGLGQVAVAAVMETPQHARLWVAFVLVLAGFGLSLWERHRIEDGIWNDCKSIYGRTHV